MNKPAHLIGGLTAGIAASEYIVPSVSTNGLIDGIISTGVVLCGAMFGSLLPDIDHPNSYIGRRLKVASMIISKTLGHRSVVHTPLIIFAFPTLLYFFAMKLTGAIHDLAIFYIIGLSAGMWSHLLLDMMTRRGIPLFYPLTKKSFSIAKFRGGGIGDTLAIMGCTILIVLIFLGFEMPF